jgi:hypothetical protein
MPSLPMSGMFPPVNRACSCWTELSAWTKLPIQLYLDLGIWNQEHIHRKILPCKPPRQCSDLHTVSSFLSDQESGIYPLEWEDLLAFHMWHQEEELAHSIMLIAYSLVSGGCSFLQKHVYICIYQLSGSPNKFKKKFPHRFHKHLHKMTHMLGGSTQVSVPNGMCSPRQLMPKHAPLPSPMHSSPTHPLLTCGCLPNHPFFHRALGPQFFLWTIENSLLL